MNFTKNNIALMIIGFLLFITLTILIIILIWKNPFEMPTSFKYKKYTEQEAQDKICEIYTELIARKLTNKEYDWLYEHTAKEQIAQDNITKETYRTFLLKNEYYSFSSNLQAGKYTTYKNGDKTIYEIQFKINDKIKIINVTESSLNDFYISYGDKTFEEATEKTLKGSSNGINIEMKRTYKDKEAEIYDVYITNTLDQTVEFEFLDVTNIKLKDSYGYSYNLNMDVSSVIDEPLTKDSKIKKEMTFLIPDSAQPNVDSIVFFEVKINGQTQTLEVKLS